MGKSDEQGMTIDQDARWLEIQRLSDAVARKDDAPGELESALCGAVWRAREWEAALGRINEVTEAVNMLLDAEEMQLHNVAIFKGKFKKGSKAWDGKFIEDKVNEAMVKLRAILRP